MRALDQEPTPATFSRAALAHVLRDSLGYEGLVVTDAIHMGALTSRYTFGERILRPVLAGADIVLNTYDPEGAVRVLRGAVASGRLPLAQVDASVRRILVHKAWLGLHRQRRSDPVRLTQVLARTHGERVAEAVARESVTLVERGPLPLAEGQRVALVQLSNFDARRAASTLEGRLRLGGLDVVPVEASTTAPEAVREAYAVVIAVHLQVLPAEQPTLSPRQHRVVDAVLSTGTPAIVVLFGNPYAALEVNASAGLVLAYDGIPRTAAAVSDVLLGRAPAPGRLPIALPGRYRRGHAVPAPLAPEPIPGPAAPIALR